MTTPAERTEAVTEPTQAQIDEAENLKNLYLPNLDNSVVPWLPNIIAHIRREARNAALEEAAQRCHEIMMSTRYGEPVFDYDYPDDFDQGRASGAETCANELRALKDQP